MKKRITSSVLALVFVLLLGVCASAETYTAMQVDWCNEYVTLRALPDTSSASLKQVWIGEVVMAMPYNSDFSYCCFNGQFGYILSRYLNPQVTGYSEGRFRVANCNSYVTLRTMPLAGSDVNAKVPLGAEFDAVYYHDGGYDPEEWAYARYNGQYGWVRWKYLEYCGGQ